MTCFFKGYVGVQAQGAAEGIKARAEIRRGSRHTDGHTFHIFSPVCGMNCSLAQQWSAKREPPLEGGAPRSESKI